MRYGQGLLDEILRRTDIVQLVGRRVKLIRKGRVMWGCCPFHKEKSPSFKVENERRTYKCFGCGKGGDAFKWLMETEGLSFREAVERLAAEAGVELPKWTQEDEDREQQKKSLYDIIEAACVFFEDQLRAPNAGNAREYLLSRGLNGEAARQFRLGYAPGGNALKEYLTGKNVPLDDMIAAGLVRPADEERGPRDFFYDRIMFPIADPRGRVVAFGGRALSADAKPKYVNTGETSLFSKGHMLYNFARARPAAIKAQNIVVAEGYMDVIALVRAGFEAAVAPLGTALTEDQLHLLWRVAAEPILAFDGDEAGLRAAHRAARLALPHLKAGYSLRFAFLPAGEDPDSFIRASGPAAMRKILDNAEPLAQVLWRGETDGKDFSTPERRAGLERSLGEIVAAIGDTKIADYYRRDFDNRVFEEFKRRKPAPQPERNRFEHRKGSRPFPPKTGGLGSGPVVSAAVKNSLIAKAGKGGARRLKELELAVLLWEGPHLAALHGEILAELPFADRSLDRFRHELLNLAASGGRLETRALENHLVRVGQSELAEQLARRASGEIASATAKDDADRGPADADANADDLEARWLRAATQLREIAELDPERARAVERFRNEASEESWREVQVLLERRAARGK
ncbi:MAG TPA: DNA primase [Rhizomicrobium sp.]|nr:DNA primase [Rhizomicrobium sp.]